MDLRQLTYVLAVIDEGGFTAAAKSLGIAQPSLSQSVRGLENELGVELFHRVGRSVVPTSAGEAIVGPARQAVRAADAARSAVAGVVTLQGGRLDLVCLPTLSVDPVAELVGRFRRSAPGVRVRLEEPETGSLLEMVQTGASEIGITEVGPRIVDLTATELGRQDFAAVLPPSSTGGDWPKASSAALGIDRLAGLPLITTPAGTSTRRLIEDAFGAHGLEPSIAVVSEHREAIVPLVIGGSGMSILPTALAEEARRLGAVVRPITPRIQRRVGIVHRDAPLTPAGRLFVDLALGRVPGHPPRPRARRR